MPTEEAIPIPRVRTQRSEPPLPEERIPPRLQPWVDEALDDVVIGGILLEWTEVVNHASAAGWGLGVPPGEAVFTAFIASGEADPRGGATDRDFARWLLGALGREVRAALVDRRSLEHLSEHIRSVLETGVRLARAVDASAQIVLRVPPSIGPSDRFRWLVDEGVATMLGNPPSELHRPLVMIRPLLLWDGEVAIEGLVA